ncbi:MULTISPECIES: ABC transporter substrate-binding protein [Micrococcaceae]|uniref:ABC transporter substrate-binding protein n=1 Tax=Micrococcaceae TaxID=1268 RepID=UPI002AA6E06E|nr:ABC transporter substrate-binding protein [Pseudarthrobacter oxydans]WPU09096.1 ABC transporter substrate-binding protein [Pseudarthrobacter oxydans]HET7783194.1 ABC transporter substrate-binding protein [Arthrobacter sp.]
MSDLAHFDVSRRTLLKGGLLALATGPLLAACGVNTSGSGGAGSVNFLSTQFSPVEERQKYEATLKKFAGDIKVAYNPVDTGIFNTTLKSQLAAGKVEVGIAGGLHGDLVPFASQLEDLSSLMKDLSSAGYSDDLKELSKLGTDVPRYIPWIQATYVLAINKKALEWLPSGADVNKLTYDQYLAWAQAAKAANGRPVFGLPAGPKGLHHRFYQGFLLPSFTGGQITTFRNPDAVTAWTYMRELWANMNPASANYDFMQEPLGNGEVLVAWDHVARLITAVKDKPDEWLMVPAPSGPKGKGYLLIVGGMAVPQGSPEKDKAFELIKALSKPEAQIETLKSNSFFPVVKTDVGGDLPGGVALEAKAVKAQQEASDALLALPPVGLGEKDPQVSQLFKNCFQEICLNNADVKATLDRQGAELAKIMDSLNVPCWAPDPKQTPCKVA